jgi:hypothetical protein
MSEFREYNRVIPVPNPEFPEHVDLYNRWAKEMIGERGAANCWHTDVCEDCFWEMDGTSANFDHKNVWITNEVLPLTPMSQTVNKDGFEFGVYEPNIHMMNDPDCELYIWMDDCSVNPLELYPDCECAICGHVNPEEQQDWRWA